MAYTNEQLQEKCTRIVYELQGCEVKELSVILLSLFTALKTTNPHKNITGWLKELVDATSQAEEIICQ